MKQTKRFKKHTGDENESLDDQINSFIVRETVEVIDVKYQCVNVTGLMETALVIYEGPNKRFKQK